ncbi:GNAT family N-acetyltransferase [Kribbella sp. NPDC003557]|uniref:GNAT family N-acetyltransferase n=1 Tax=Kribbella sp. NPDC003557 TaxID=3154449 RepID=UPI0033A14B43
MTRAEDHGGLRVLADPVLDRATAAAEAAALTAGVTVREIRELTELEEVVRLYAAIWGNGTNPQVTVELLRALTKAGNYVGGAFAGDRLVGACVGFFHAPSEDALHSHIAGVSRDGIGRGIGFALKLHQRSWALGRGVSEVAWTFDPLIRRNAYFNLVKLGARADEYLPNFYGAMTDAINGGDDSDRLLVRWRLADPAVMAACEGMPHAVDTGAAVVALGISDAGAPVAGPPGDGMCLVAVPPDVEGLRVRQPALARAWRTAVRETLGALLSDGGRITGFDRAGWYVVRREQ